MLLHMDCSEGVSVTSLAKAILSLNDTPTGISSEWLERKILKIFPEIVQDIKFHPKETFYEIHFSESASLDELLAAIDNTLELQETLQQRGRNFVGKLREGIEGHKEHSSSQSLQSAILSICALLWFDILNIQGVSLSPIPVLSKQISECPSLWMHLPVLVASTAPFVTTEAIILLTILLDIDKRSTDNPVNCSAPPMILTQHSSGTYHLPTPHTTSISVGTSIIISEKESPPLPSSLWQTDRLYMLEANIDDCTAEYLAFCVDLLLTSGAAADAWVTPIVMKKGRAAHTIQCLCKETNRDTCLELLFRHSTTLGIRVKELDRMSLKRTMVTVESKKWNSNNNDDANSMRVNVKVGYLGEQIVSTKAEFDHCSRIATSLDLTIKAVADEAVQLAKQKLKKAHTLL